MKNDLNYECCRPPMLLLLARVVSTEQQFIGATEHRTQVRTINTVNYD